MLCKVLRCRARRTRLKKGRGGKTWRDVVTRMENPDQIKPFMEIDFGGNKGDVLDLAKFQNISLVYIQYTPIGVWCR